MHLVVDRYVRGSLSGSELAEFEERLVWDQGLLEEVQLAEHLRAGLQLALQKNEAQRPAGSGGPMRWLFDYLSMPAYAAAASFALAVGLSAGVFMGPLAGSSSSSVPGALPTVVVPIFATRSQSAQEILVTEDTWTVLLVETPPGYDRYGVIVQADGASEDVWSQRGLVPTFQDSVAVGMPSSLLTERRFVIVLEGLREATGSDEYEHIQRIPFEVARPD